MEFWGPVTVSDHILSEHLGIVILTVLEPLALVTPPGSPLASAEVVEP